jgi:hypothetical protein
MGDHYGLEGQLHASSRNAMIGDAEKLVSLSDRLLVASRAVAAGADRELLLRVAEVLACATEEAAAGRMPRLN